LEKAGQEIAVEMMKELASKTTKAALKTGNNKAVEKENLLERLVKN